MPAAKIAITIEQQLLKPIDRLVAQRKFQNRSRAIQEAVRPLARANRFDRRKLLMRVWRQVRMTSPAG